MNPTLIRWGQALLVLAPVILLVAAFAAVPSFIDETTTKGDVRAELQDMRDNETATALGVAFQFLAAAAVIGGAAFLASRTRQATALTNAGLLFAGVVAVLLVASAAVKIALLDQVAKDVAQGDTPDSTLLLGQALADIFNAMLGMSTVAIALWVGSSAGAMLQTGAFSRGPAYAGIAAALLVVLGTVLGAVEEAFYALDALGLLVVLMWAIWIAVSIIREGEPASDLRTAQRSVAPQV